VTYRFVTKQLHILTVLQPFKVISNKVKVKVQQSRYRPGQALRVPGGLNSQI